MKARATIRLSAAVGALAIAAPAARADFEDGMKAYRAGDLERAFEEFRQGAIRGDALAEYALGSMYGNGEGVARNDRKAIKWLRRAAVVGFPVAQRALGILYSREDTASSDEAEAVHWYRRAASHGDAPAQAALGMLYATGRGVERDDVAAYAWLDVAVRLGYEQAAPERDRIGRRLAPDELRRARERSADWRPRWPRILRRPFELEMELMRLPRMPEGLP